MTLMEWFGYITICSAVGVIGAFVIAFAWFTLRDKQRAREYNRRKDQSVDHVIELPALSQPIVKQMALKDRLERKRSHFKVQGRFVTYLPDGKDIPCADERGMMGT